MLRKIETFLSALRSEVYISQALARAAATQSRLDIDEKRPQTWEFSGFSQNGEDGITDFLVGKINDPDRHFIEIGASTGVDNNTAWLAIARGYSGLMIEGNRRASDLSRYLMSRINPGVECHNIFVNKDNIHELQEMASSLCPDYLSLDIDGNDYYLMKEIFNCGFRPAVIAVEYNSAYGPENSLTIEYDPAFVIDFQGDEYLYYGVSIAGWRRFFATYGYKFVCVDSRGVNAFFLMPGRFETEFVDGIDGLDFQENFYQMRKYKCSWAKQFTTISHRKFREI
ncbi:MAG: hypothetical protein CML33_02830 [Rhodobacteraceae bacterium]|nr:hypothetical protein [Paracoccaceae bacterium]